MHFTFSVSFSIQRYLFGNLILWLKLYKMYNHPIYPWIYRQPLFFKSPCVYLNASLSIDVYCTCSCFCLLVDLWFISKAYTYIYRKSYTCKSRFLHLYIYKSISIYSDITAFFTKIFMHVYHHIDVTSSTWNAQEPIHLENWSTCILLMQMPIKLWPSSVLMGKMPLGRKAMPRVVVWILEGLLVDLML